MKKLVLHGAAFALLLAGSASAADLRRPAPVMVPAPAPVAVYNWTGCYVGAGGGYGMWNQETRFVNGGAVFGLSNDNGGRGWFGTVQVGCDYQIGSNIVIGAFADYDFSGIKGDMSIASADLVGREKLKSSWAVGGRIGWLPFQQLLVFVSGGYTQARFSDVNYVIGTTGDPSNLSIGKHTYSGWFLGTGYEYGIGWLPGLFWKTEYRFADYGSDRVTMLDLGVLTTDGVDTNKRIHTVRSELVWRFNWGGAVAAPAVDERRPMPVKAPVPAPVAAVYNWSGCYVGAGSGYGMWNQESQYIASVGPAGASNDNGGRGWFGTVQVGCDYQLGSNIVIGAAADYDFGGIKGDMSVPIQVWVGEEKLKSSWAAGGRAGWLPFQQLLVFVSGGYSEARFGQVNFVSATSGEPVNVSLARHTYSGWFLGTGYEYGIGWLPIQGLFWKTEYRFADYGSDTVRLTIGDSLDLHKRVHTVRSELVWRFNFGGPVVARY
jgi:outer membrane immunogenic protein